MENSQTKETHRIPFVEKLGMHWTLIGWGLFAILLPVSFDIAFPALVHYDRAELLSIVITGSIIGRLATLGGYLWGLADMYDRRPKGIHWGWAIVLFFLTAAFGLGLLLYLLLARKRISQSVNIPTS